MQIISFRSSHWKCSVRKGVLRNSIKLTGKHLCQSLFFTKVAGRQSFFFNKVAAQRPATLLKKRLAQVFSCKFCEISKNTFFTEHHWETASSVLIVLLKVSLQLHDVGKKKHHKKKRNKS